MAMKTRGCIRFLGAALLVGVLSLGCASLTGPPPKPLTQEAIIQMTKSGWTDSQILDRIRESRTAYRLTSAEVVNLHNEGVSYTVLDYMLQTYIDAVRADERYASERYWLFHYGHYYWCPPHVIVVRHR
jgi:hypothetical protein